MNPGRLWRVVSDCAVGSGGCHEGRLSAERDDERRVRRRRHGHRLLLGSSGGGGSGAVGSRGDGGSGAGGGGGVGRVGGDDVGEGNSASRQSVRIDDGLEIVRGISEADG